MPDDKQAFQAAEAKLNEAQAAFDALPDDYDMQEVEADFGRKRAARWRRFEAAQIAFNRDIEPSENASNGDEDEFLFPKPDEKDDRSFIANYTKGMSHDDLGEVDPRSDYDALLTAVAPPFVPAEYEAIPRGPRPDIISERVRLRRYVNPQAAVAFSLMAPDPPQAGVLRPGSLEVDPFPAAPKFSSPEAAAEMGELYWMSLLRDVPFNEFQGSTTSNPLIQAAVDSLNRFTDFRGPKKGGKVTPQTLFRGGNYFRDPAQQISGGELVGPYLSQFLLIGTEILEGRGPVDQFSAGQPFAETEEGEKVIPPGSSTGLVVKREEGMVQYGALTIDQRQREIAKDLDFMTDYRTWLRIQQGIVPSDKNVFTGARKFMFNGRAAANWVHFDQSYEADYIALLLLLGMQGRADALGVALFSEGNPYNPPGIFPDNPGAPSSRNQTGFGTFGNGHFLALIAEADRRAIEAVWYQKWNVHRRLRPETYSGRIHNVILEPRLNRRYDINDEILSDEDLLKRVFNRNKFLNEKLGRDDKEGTYLLNQVFPEGSPMHPSYGAGHATEAGARLTIMKAQFNEDFEITDPFDPNGTSTPGKPYNPALIASADGTKLIPYTGAGSDKPLVVWQELNKLAANIAINRNFAGVHYRTDYTASVRMGEQVALGLLQEQAANFNEDQFFQLTLLDLRIVRVTRSGIVEVGRRDVPPS